MSKGQLGIVASVSTIAYMVGKVLWGPFVDKIGGRNGFLGSMLLVAFFGALGAFAPSVFLLTIVYSANRFAGSAGWMSMVKLVPEWFSKKHMATAMAFLSLSFVFGGVCATFFAGGVVKLFGSWRAVMGIPSIVLVLIAVVCWFYIPRHVSDSNGSKARPKRSAIQWLDVSSWLHLFANRRFCIVCGLSFTLTLMRETFNTWTVDFLHEIYSSTEMDADAAVAKAAFRSTLFDLLGAAGILVMGEIYDKVGHRRRGWVLASIMATLALLLCFLNSFAEASANHAAVAVGVIGFLVYGPYSLLAGVMAVEVAGKQKAATVSGLVDASGYLSGILAGAAFGLLVDKAGYGVGFVSLAGLAVVSGFLCLFLGPATRHVSERSDDAVSDEDAPDRK